MNSPVSKRHVPLPVFGCLIAVITSLCVVHSVCAAFDPNCNGRVFDIALQNDGKVVIGGEFTSGGGVDGRQGIARLHSDGRFDTGFNVQLNGAVYATAIQPDGRILVGGTFSSVNSSARPYLVRLNPDGTVDTTFRPQAGGAPLKIVVLPNGQILIGGVFQSWAN